MVQASHKMARVSPRGFSNEQHFVHGTAAQVDALLAGYGDDARVRKVSAHRSSDTARARAEQDRRRQGRDLRNHALQDWCSVVDAAERLALADA